MKLLMEELRSRLPKLDIQEKNKDPTVHVLCSAEHKTCYVSPEIMLCCRFRARIVCEKRPLSKGWPVFSPIHKYFVSVAAISTGRLCAHDYFQIADDPSGTLLKVSYTARFAPKDGLMTYIRAENNQDVSHISTPTGHSWTGGSVQTQPT